LTAFQNRLACASVIDDGFISRLNDLVDARPLADTRASVAAMQDRTLNDHFAHGEGPQVGTAASLIIKCGFAAADDGMGCVPSLRCGLADPSIAPIVVSTLEKSSESRRPW
jgi:hypothetical protein